MLIPVYCPRKSWNQWRQWTGSEPIWALTRNRKRDENPVPYGVAPVHVGRPAKMDRLEPHQLKLMVASCLAGDAGARITFQNLFGETIYNYPLKAFRLPKDKAADFYVYVFEKDRVFRRLSTFEGRNEAQFETYLCFYVLPDLFFEWQRSQKELDTVSWDPIASEGNREPNGVMSNGVSGSPLALDDLVLDSQETPSVNAVVLSLDFEKRVVLKLLCLAEIDLCPDEIRFIAQKSARSYREVVTLVEQIRHTLMKKDEQSSALQDQLDSIFGWILLYQKELTKNAEKLRSVATGGAEHSKLRREKEEWDRKLEWRYRQQRRVQEKARQFRITTPYKDIARLLNVPIGTVCSLVARTRLEMSGSIGDRLGSPQAVAP